MLLRMQTECDRTPRRRERRRRLFRALAASVLPIAATAFAHAADNGNRYAQYSDAALTRVAARWQQLDTDARRDFFIEMRRRMQQSGRSAAIPVRVERRFGRVVRRADGSLVRIERIIRVRSRRVRPLPARPPAEYGSGFERRMVREAAARRRPQEGASAPQIAPIEAAAKAPGNG